MTNINEVMELDWNSTIEKDSNTFTILPAGEYDFTVEKFERAWSKAGNKMAKLTLKVTGNELSAVVFDNITLVNTMEWKLSSFFGALGLKKKGERLIMDWDSIYGKTGRCKIKVSEGQKQDGSTYERNEIDNYIYKEDVTVNEPVQQSFKEEKQGFTGNFSFK